MKYNLSQEKKKGFFFFEKTKKSIFRTHLKKITVKVNPQNELKMRKKTILILALLTQYYIGIAQTPVYFNIVSHNEISDSLDYTDVQADFNFIRPMIKELCDTIISKQAKYNMQVDGNFINGVLKWNNGASSFNDILEWANNSQYIDVDGHNHFNPIPNDPNNKYNPYKYPDLAKLLDSCGVILTHNILGGITYADTVIGNITLNENWTIYQTPTPGFTFTNYYWQADIVWGTATPSHIADYTHFGVWKPAGGSSPTQFGTHDPSKNITHVGGGCKNNVSYILDGNGQLVRTTSEVIAAIKSVVDDIQNIPTSSNDFYTMNMLINFRDIPNIPNYADSIGVIIDGLQSYVNQGKIVWATLGEKYDLWYANHSNPNDYFNIDCADIPILATGISSIKTDDNLFLYPNPTDGIINMQLQDNNNIERIEIFNLIGEKLYAKPFQINQPISIKNYDKGIYMIRLISKNGSFITKKIIKK